MDLVACELTLSLFSIAANSYRKETVCSPLPFLPLKQLECGSMLTQLLEAMDRLPPLSSLVETSSLRSLSLPEIALLSSLLLAARVRLKTVTNDNDDDGTVVSHGGAWTEVKVVQQIHDWCFDSLRLEYGVREAYHGSSAENLHSICHRGLRNMSQTRHERHGAAFGEGVYLSTDASLSKEFSKQKLERHSMHQSSSFRKYTKDNRAEFPFEIVCRCDVINRESNFVPRIGHSTKRDVDYLVVKDESHILVRSLLLFATSKFHEPTISNDDTSSLLRDRLPEGDEDIQKPFGRYFYPLLALFLLCAFACFNFNI